MGHGLFYREGSCEDRESHSGRDGIPRHGRGGYGDLGWSGGLLRTAPPTQHQHGEWWSGVKHLGALLLVNAKESGTSASLELQLRASAPRDPEKVALIPNQQSLAADPPTQPLGGEGSREVSKPGRVGEGLQCAGLGQSRCQKGAGMAGHRGGHLFTGLWCRCPRSARRSVGTRPGIAPAARLLQPAAQE